MQAYRSNQLNEDDNNKRGGWGGRGRKDNNSNLIQLNWSETGNNNIGGFGLLVLVSGGREAGRIGFRWQNHNEKIELLPLSPPPPFNPPGQPSQRRFLLPSTLNLSVSCGSFLLAGPGVSQRRSGAACVKSELNIITAEQSRQLN